MNDEKEKLALDYFIGGVPAGPLFKLDLDRLKDMVNTSEQETVPRSNPAAEIGLIALVAYFEAFCKNEFASLVNICPQILANFFEKRKDVTLKAKDLLLLDEDIRHSLGSLLSEKYDFGTAKKINGLFHDLVSITPFSKKEMGKYDQLVNDRNLLVHHGGIYTTRYHGRRFGKQAIGGKVFFDSLVVRKEAFFLWAHFTEKIVRKVIAGCHKSLANFIEAQKIDLSDQQEKAFSLLDWYG